LIDDIIAGKSLALEEANTAIRTVLFCITINYYLALSLYSQVCVLITIFSHSVINKGTCTTDQVSKVAGFDQPVAVSHFNHGPVSATSKTTLGASSILITFQFHFITLTSILSAKKFT